MLSKRLFSIWALCLIMALLTTGGAHAMRVMPGVNLSGGAKDIVGSAFFGEQVNLVYAAGSGAGSMQGVFEIPGPPTEPMFVHLMAIDDDFPEITPISLTLNGNVIFEGENPFPQAPNWGMDTFPIPDEALNAGENVLVIQNLSTEGAIGMPPWFMVAWVAIAEASFDFNNLPPAPEAPSGLSADADGGFQIDLSWTDNADNEIGFLIERREDLEGTAFEKIGSVAAGVTTFNDEDVTPARTFLYRVRAFNDGGFSAYSDEASATTEEALIVELDSKTPAQFNAIIGKTVQLGVEVFFASDDPSFQWYKADPAGGDPIPVGVDASVLVYDAIAFEDAGVYWCEVTSGAEVVESPQINLTVTEALPVGGVMGLGLLTGLLALVAIRSLRQRSC